MFRSFWILVTFYIHIPVSWVCMEVFNMSELSSAIIGAASGIVAAIISGVVSVGILNHKISVITRHLGFGDDEASMKRQLDEKLGSSGKSISEQLGIGSKSISEQLGVGNKSISDMLGVGIDDKSLSKQHEELKQIIASKLDLQSAGINSITQKINDEESRRNNLELNQQQVLQCVNALVSQWGNSQSQIEQLKRELDEYKGKNNILENENAALRLQIENDSHPCDDEDEFDHE